MDQGNTQNLDKYQNGNLHKQDPTETKKHSSKIPIRYQQDFWIWFGGMLFAGLLIGCIYIGGYIRGWDADSGYTHNESLTSQDRFLPEPFIPEPGVPGRDANGSAARWYYWKLKPSLITWYTRCFPWICYTLHQIFVLTTIYMIQNEKKLLEKMDRYSHKLGKWNWIAFGGNIFFNVLHLVQTHLTYDGLAQDVSVSSSQAAAITVLLFILIIEYRDRGLFFGWPSRYDTGKHSERAKLPYCVMYIVRRYHGYLFAWAMVYTLWYHPYENTGAHSTGFLHIYMVLLQGSLALTRFHLNKYWRFLLETFVTAHGGLVAAQTGGPDLLGTKLWPMFVFGFAFVLVFTQLYGLPFWRKIPVWTRVFPPCIYIAIVIWCYSWIPDSNGKTWVRMQEIIRIPAVYYGFFIAIWLWQFALIKIQEKFCTVGDNVRRKSRILALIGITFIYLIFIACAIAVEVTSVSLDLIILMIIFCAIFTFGAAITNVLFNWVLALPTSLLFVKEEFNQETVKFAKTGRVSPQLNETAN